MTRPRRSRRDRHATADHLVRPRWVWGGLLLAVVGAGTLSWGVVSLSWASSLVGAALLLLGAGAGLRGGVLYDAVPTLAARHQLRQAVDGDVHPGIAPGDTLATPAARQDALATNQALHAREAAAQHQGEVHWAPVAGWLLLLLGAVLTVSQWELVAPTATGRGNSLRDTAVAIVLGLAGLRIAVVPGRHRIATGLTGLAGIGLILAALLADHDHQSLAVVEAAGGCVAALCSLAAAASPSAGRSTTA